MTTQSEIILARYRHIEKEADAVGRVIGVRKLKPSEQSKVAGMTAELTGYDDIVAPDGSRAQVPHRMPLLVAASVCEIDGVPIPFARNRGELDAIYDRLDVEGIAAAGAAMARMMAPDSADPVTEAKN